MGEKNAVAEIQSLSPTAEVELFVIDTTKFGGDVIRFCSGVNAFHQPIYWQGERYDPLPIEASDFDVSSQGTLPTPKLILANVSGLFSSLAAELDNLIGCKVIRKRTFGRFLDEVNFPNGNPEADPTQHLPDQIWFIDRKVNESRVSIEWELASAFDFQGVQLPFGQVTKNACRWQYRSPDCGWTGGYFSKDDKPTDDPNLDACGKRVSSCTCRFGENAVLPYGAFPGVQRV
ncbi:phage minor tail protein L [Acinetobacter baumannii]|uniref:Phage minor tail protein L n=1 Tax=Acinetobacter baumannii NIPH 80 TaxID=1217629 RepID=N9L8V3_ACIBA|nr:phage minor tail protein L [Acinetobacter baumannii]EHU3242100.1 phage minor tail protein L [Acinetobacter baumannii]EHU3427483.1 phage minor tail protein L [Acinetobacter baumannii]EKT8316494.1 phage minor tail protein L [Acinetobacter baumannii]EKT9346842.1 phage minor tail protein L [Acinetobacter baumannii]EKT9979378.1 phage minor tail protein L [Acinetobacter baumannii]